jgi:hypothetical protein
MTDVFHQEANAPIEMALPDVALPKPVKSDWSPQDPAAQARTQQGKERQERRGAIEAARAKVESGWTRPGHQTKSERLAAAASKGDRDTGSPKERASTRSSIQRAMAKVNEQPSPEELNRPETRKDREAFKARYPGVKASELFARSEQWEKDFRADPVATRERIFQTYAEVSPQNFKETVETEKEHGVRGSVRQAQADQADLADLKPYMDKYGKNFPHILSQLQKFDADMIADPAGVSARLAANYGAPVTESQIDAYQQKRGAEQHRAQDSANVDKAIGLIIEHKVLEGMESAAMQNAIADVLLSKDFQRTGDRFGDLKRAHAHVMAGRTAAKQDDRGNRSISGAPSTSNGAGRDQTRRNQTAVGSAVSRAMSKG